MTSRGNPNFCSFIKNLRFWVFQTDGQTDRQTDREINLRGLGNYAPPGKNILMKFSTLCLLVGITGGFTFFPSLVALALKNLS